MSSCSAVNAFLQACKRSPTTSICSPMRKIKKNPNIKRANPVVHPITPDIKTTLAIASTNQVPLSDVTPATNAAIRSKQIKPRNKCSEVLVCPSCHNCVARGILQRHQPATLKRKIILIDSPLRYEGTLSCFAKKYKRTTANAAKLFLAK